MMIKRQPPTPSLYLGTPYSVPTPCNPTKSTIHLGTPDPRQCNCNSFNYSPSPHTHLDAVPCASDGTIGLHRR